MILLLLASGRGSRLRSLTEDKPKCLVKIENQFLYYSLSLFEQFDKNFLIKKFKSFNEIKKYIALTININFFIIKIINQQIWFTVCFIHIKK